jgi:hypothetical protein
MTLKVAREISKVQDGTGTTSAATSITDTLNLTQQNQYWDKGTVWFRSLTHSGKTAVITGFSSNKITFPTMGSDVGSCRYAVSRSLFPYSILQQSVNNALDEIRVTEKDSSLLGDGTTLEFTLPAGVSNVERVEIEEYGYTPAKPYPSNHWTQFAGKIKFDYGYAPWDGDTINLYHKTSHDELTTYSDTIHEDVNEEWLKWKACEHALYWGIKKYQDAKEYRLEELMNKVMERQRGLLPTPVTVKLRTAGA